MVAVEDGYAWIQTARQSACSHCQAGTSCGTSVLSRWFGRRQPRIRVPNALDLAVGQRAVIGIDDQVLVKASLIAYLMPLLGMIGFALLAVQWGLAEGAVALMSLGGLAAGLWLMARLGRGGRHGAYQVRLLRAMPETHGTTHIEFN